jgi:CheY-like chemotaxis protein
VRQALLNMLTASAQIAEGGSVLIHLWASAEQIHIAMQSQPPAVTPASRPADEPEILELTRELLEAAGGSLVIISGDGSHTLELALPLSAPREFSVLVVDDNADALQLYQRYLSGSRYRCHTLQKAEETLAVAAALRPSLILLDVMMPETDGWTLLHDLREQAGTQAIPIIVCSILPHQKLALALGAAEFLRKPVTRSALLAAMERQLSPGLTEAG